MSTSLKEAKNLVQFNAPGRYHGATLQLLGRLVSLAFVYSATKAHQSKNENVEDRDITKKYANIWRGIHVRERQQRKILSQLVTEGIVLYEREGKNITYRLNLQPLKELPAADIISTEQKHKEWNKARTEKARALRARNRFQFTELLALLLGATAAAGLLPYKALEAIAPSRA